jgi:hypothetical protein
MSETTSNETTKDETGDAAIAATNGANGTTSDAPQPVDLRIRMKIWTDPATSRRYLMPTAIMPDPKSGVLTAYAMTDEDTRMVRLTAAEWNALPFFYFREDGPAPRAIARPPDAIR